MVMPIARAHRLRHARITVNTLLQQLYRPLELIVVNATGQPVFTRSTEQAPFPLQEIMVTASDWRQSSPATMRNRGILAASGAYILPVDDDDYSHPNRILHQMAAIVGSGSAASCLRHQIRFDCHNRHLRIVERADGIPGTLLFAKRLFADREQAPYNEELLQDEDLDLHAEIAERTTLRVLDNGMPVFPGPALSIAFHHGDNIQPREVFFGEEEPAADWKDPSLLRSRPHREFLAAALLPYGFRVSVKDDPYAQENSSVESSEGPPAD